ncbi:MAG: signal peptide peptidase SppA [Coriobacteriia bacterium]
MSVPEDPQPAESTPQGSPQNPPPFYPSPVGAPGVPSVPGAPAPSAAPGAPAPGASPYGYGPGYAAPPPYGPSSAYQQPPRKRRVWGWIVAGVVLLIVLVVGCGMLGTIFSSSSDDFTGDTIAVIPFSGTIAGTSSGSLSGGEITPQSFLALLRQAEDDPAVRAIVLRVDSPGGTVAASEEIAQYVKEAEKPIVVSVGDIDASGAYMVSSQADKIIAVAGSTVGSIGVILETYDISGLLDKVGVEFKVITAGEYKDAGSPYRSLTATEVAMLQGEVDEVYNQFVDIVAEGRGMDREEVLKLATGWAWSGQEAQKLGLVDEIGTYQDALDAAAELGGIEGEYNVEVYGESADTLLRALIGIESKLGTLTDALKATSTTGKTSVPK